MALTFLTVAEFKARGNATPSYPDATITAILTSVEASIRAYLNFNPLDTTITEYLDGRATQRLQLKRWPVTAIAHVYEDYQGNYGQSATAFPSTSELTQGTDYDWVIESGSTAGVLYRIGQFWPWLYTRNINDLSNTADYCPGCVKVNYTIDNTDVLSAATEAGYLESQSRYLAQLTGTGVTTSDSMDGASVGVNPTQRFRKNDPADGFASSLTAGILNAWRMGRFV